MADPGEQTKKSDIGQHWQKQHQRMVDYAKKDWTAMKLGAVWMWYQPDAQGWNKDLFDLTGMSQPFDRQDQFNDFDSVTKDGNSPGCVGDLMAIQLQGDYLGTLERAFRERHKSWPRMMVHSNARRYGHQHDLGVFQTGFKSYLQFILKQTGQDKPA
jgi:hypothetical protein